MNKRSSARGTAGTDFMAFRNRVNTFVPSISIFRRGFMLIP